MRRRAFFFERVKQKIDNLRPMHRLNRFWLSIAIVAFCFGIAIGRFAIPTSTSNPVARAGSISNNRSSGIETNGATVQHHSGSKRNSRPESTEAAGPDGNIYARITDSLTASGTARLYDSFGKFSNLIDQKNVRDVLAFAEKISKKEHRDALTLLILARWAEFDPKEALTFAQSIPAVSSRTWALGSALSSWAQRDSAGAIAWAQQMAPGPVRDQTIQVVLSSLTEKDPQIALSVLQSLPAEKARQHFYWPIFSRWAVSDPATAAERAEHLPTRASREIALQALGSTWGKQDPEAALA